MFRVVEQINNKRNEWSFGGTSRPMCVWVCVCVSVDDSGAAAVPADEVLEVSAKVVVHERVDDGVSDVVGEVHVEHDHPVRQQVHGHQERRQDALKH